MSTLVLHSRATTIRHLRELMRQPWYIAIQLVQPVIWLILFGSLFQEALTIPMAGIEDYRAYLTPGIVLMTAIFTAGWTGMGLIDDMLNGVMNRMLVAPANRSALVNGRLIQLSIVVLIQAIVIVGLGSLTGFRGTASGLTVLLLSAVLLAWAIGAASIGYALAIRDRHAMIGVNMLVLPLMLLSTAFMHPDLMPGWISTIAAANPVDWAIVASRLALSNTATSADVLYRLAGLTALAGMGTWFAVRSFRNYQRSL